MKSETNTVASKVQKGKVASKVSLTDREGIDRFREARSSGQIACTLRMKQLE